MADRKERKKRKKVLRRLEGLAYQAPQYFGKQYQHATKELDNAHNSESIKAQRILNEEETRREQEHEARQREALSKRFQGGGAVEEI